MRQKYLKKIPRIKENSVRMGVPDVLNSCFYPSHATVALSLGAALWAGGGYLNEMKKCVESDRKSINSLEFSHGPFHLLHH